MRIRVLVSMPLAHDIRRQVMHHDIWISVSQCYTDKTSTISPHDSIRMKQTQTKKQKHKYRYFLLVEDVYRCHPIGVVVQSDFLYLPVNGLVGQ